MHMLKTRQITLLLMPKQFRKLGTHHQLHIFLMHTPSRIKTHERPRHFSQRDPVESSGSFGGHGGGEVVDSALGVYVGEGAEETAFECRGCFADEFFGSVELFCRLWILCLCGVLLCGVLLSIPRPTARPRNCPRPRPRTTLANHSQTLERPSSLQRILTPRKERIHPTTARINHPPHLMTHGYLVPRKPFLLGEIFHGPPSPQ